jgi:hypothetical protein
MSRHARRAAKKGVAVTATFWNATRITGCRSLATSATRHTKLLALLA